MKRKDFLSTLLPLGAVLAASASTKNVVIESSKIPPYLKRGDTIGISSPAGYIALQEIEPAILKLKEWGFNIKIGTTIGKRDFTFGGTDAERLADFQQMLDDEKVSCILCARGGYGFIRIIDSLHFKKFTKKPKWIIGFSDITVLHSHLNANFSIASIHSKMCNSFPDDWAKADDVQKESIESIKKCLVGEKMKYTITPNAKNKIGIAYGALVGGNLKTIESLAGSKSDIDTTGKILFVEDTGEYLYSLDRMFWNLKRSGKLNKLSALLIGGFKIKKDDVGEEFGKSIEEIVLEKVAAYNYPVCFDFAVGHQKNNFALKCGVQHKLSVHLNECMLIEVK